MRAPATRKHGRATDGSPRVLVVEDEVLVAMGVEAVLTNAGLEVVGIAASADDAVRLAKSTRPDIAVMDVRLKGERDGIDAAVEMRASTGIRCIFATAYADLATRARAEPAAPIAWVPKPYAAAALIPLVQAAVAELRRHK